MVDKENANKVNAEIGLEAIRIRGYRNISIYKLGSQAGWAESLTGRAVEFYISKDNPVATALESIYYWSKCKRIPIFYIEENSA